MSITPHNNLTCPATPLYSDQSLYYVGERVLKPLIDLVTQAVWPVLPKPQARKAKGVPIVREFEAYPYVKMPRFSYRNDFYLRVCLREKEIDLRRVELGYPSWKNHRSVCKFPF